MSRTRNITDAWELEESGLLPGDPVHLGVAGPGPASNDVRFCGRLLRGSEIIGVRVTIHGRELDIYWGDIIELWPLTPREALSGPEKAGLVSEYTRRVGD